MSRAHSPLLLRARRRRRAAVHDRRARDRRLRARTGSRRPTAPPRALRRPRAAAAQAVPQIQPAPGGVRREYWIQAETVRWAITPERRDEWHNRRLTSRNVFTAYVYRPMTPGFADYAIDHPTIPGPTLTAEVGDVLVVHFRNADRTLEPGGHDAPARRQVQPGVRRRLHGRVHARGRLHRARRDVHLPVGVHAGLGRRLALSRPRPQPHAQHVPRAVRRDDRAAQGRAAARPRLHAVRPPAPAAGHAAATELPLLQRPRLRGQHADADRARRRGRRDHGVRHGLELPHVPHPRPPLAGPGGDVHRQPGDGARTRASRPASSRTTRVAGSTTATSSRIRTSAWRAGTWSTPEREESHAHPTARRGPAVGAARARRRERPDVPRAQGPGPGPDQAEGPAQDPHGLQAARPLRLHDDPEGRRQGPRRRHDPRAQRRLPRGRADRGLQEALPAADRQPARPGEGPAARARATCRTGSSSTTPTRSPSTASWPAATRPTGSSSRTSTATR